MNLADEIAALGRQTVPELRQRYAALFGEATTAKHKAWLVKRIAWRLQAVGEGELSERARQRALQLANDADLRLSPPKPRPPAPGAGPPGRAAGAGGPRRYGYAGWRAGVAATVRALRRHPPARPRRHPHAPLQRPPPGGHRPGPRLRPRRHRLPFAQ